MKGGLCQTEGASLRGPQFIAQLSMACIIEMPWYFFLKLKLLLSNPKTESVIRWRVSFCDGLFYCDYFPPAPESCTMSDVEGTFLQYFLPYAHPNIFLNTLISID